jgi:hypothetical protein
MVMFMASLVRPGESVAARNFTLPATPGSLRIGSVVAHCHHQFFQAITAGFPKITILVNPGMHLT